MLIDAGPLVALAAPRQSPETTRRVLRAISGRRGPMLTNEAVLAEAFYLARSYDGQRGQRLLWRYVLEREFLTVGRLTSDDYLSAGRLMEQYHDRPMDFADALLVTQANGTGIRRIVSLDGDFRVYRTADGGHFEVLPG